MAFSASPRIEDTALPTASSWPMTVGFCSDPPRPRGSMGAPSETTYATGLSLMTMVPAGGSGQMTMPGGAAGSLTSDRAPGVTSATWSVARASASGRPTMAGTATCLGPLLTTRLTAEPTCTSVPAGGSVLTARPAGTVALVRCSVAATTRPAAGVGAAAAGPGGAAG